MDTSFLLNGKPVVIDVAPEVLLSELLREQLGLTGTHESCTLLAVAVAGARVTTIEGLTAPGSRDLHPMQQAFHEYHGLQCGFCTPGMIMSAVDLARHHPEPSEVDVRHWLEGNLCRCTGYQNIVLSVLAGAAAMQTQGG
jgi:aerobic carbon-monoxide dehydrogenase small subunit